MSTWIIVGFGKTLQKIGPPKEYFSAPFVPFAAKNF
jgi:hypothetical protein